MQLGETLKNPIVLGGGALVGIVLLMRSGGSHGAPAPSNYNPSVIANTAAVNAQVMAGQIEMAKVQAGLASLSYQADVAKQLGFMKFLSNTDDNNRIIQTQRISANAGITNSMIASSTAIIVDQSNNATRLGMSYQETARSQIGADRDVSVARYSYLGVKATAKANMFGNIAKAVSSVASSFIPVPH